MNWETFWDGDLDSNELNNIITIFTIAFRDRLAVATKPQVGRTEYLSYAVKVVENKKQKKDIQKEIENEINIMKILDHPNVVKFITSYNVDREVHIVMEFCENSQS